MSRVRAEPHSRLRLHPCKFPFQRSEGRTHGAPIGSDVIVCQGIVNGAIAWEIYRVTHRALAR